MDLYADPWATFRQITLPQLMPAIVASLLLAFTFSFDDFVIAFFVAGSNTTLPIYVFSSIRRGVTPEINAIGTLVLVVSLALMVTAQLLLQAAGRGPRRCPTDRCRRSSGDGAAASTAVPEPTGQRCDQQDAERSRAGRTLPTPPGYLRRRGRRAPATPRTVPQRSSERKIAGPAIALADDPVRAVNSGHRLILALDARDARSGICAVRRTV